MENTENNQTDAASDLSASAGSLLAEMVEVTKMEHMSTLTGRLAFYDALKPIRDRAIEHLAENTEIAHSEQTTND